MATGLRDRSNGTGRLIALLRALSRSGGSVSWGQEPHGSAAELLVRAPTGLATNSGTVVSSATVSQAASLGLIDTAAGVPAITAAGKAWLRRRLADGDPFQAQHRDLHQRVLTTPKGRPKQSALVNEAESPLAWLRRRKDRDGKPMLDEKQFEAGERLRSDFTFAALGPRVTANWSAIGGGGRQHQVGAPAPSMRDTVIAAKERVQRAMSAVGPELGSLLIDVCCMLKGIEAAESAHGLPQRSGKVVLQLGLTALARHYGLLQAKTPGPAFAHILHWGQTDFRPHIVTTAGAGS